MSAPFKRSPLSPRTLCGGSAKSMNSLSLHLESSGRRDQRSERNLAYGVSVTVSPTSLLPWQRTAAGAGLLGADGAVRPTIFAEMSALALEAGAINLGQGFPDEDGPAEVLEAAVAAIRSGANQYPPGLGVPVLREAVAEHQRRFYGVELDPEREVLIT